MSNGYEKALEHEQKRKAALEEAAAGVARDLFGQKQALTSTNLAKQPHYATLKLEPIDVSEAWNLDLYLHNVIKYVARAGRKPGQSEASDLRKALNYLIRKVNIVEGRGASWKYVDETEAA